MSLKYVWLEIGENIEMNEKVILGTVFTGGSEGKIFTTKIKFYKTYKSTVKYG